VLLLARASLARLDGPEAARGAVPVVAALLFATHPIHTEAVAWAAGMADLGFAFFGLLALLLYALGRDGRGGESLPASVALLVSALFKEPGVAVLGVMAAYELAARAPGESWSSSLLRLAPPGLAVASYAALRFAALGGLVPTVAEPWDPPRQMAAALALLGLDLRFLILPVGLNFGHVFRPPASPVAAEVLIAAGWVAAAAAAAVRAIRRSRAMAVATALLLLPLLPALHAGALNQGIGNAFTERYLYLPSAGFLVLLAWWGARIARRLSPPSWPGILAAALLVAAYATATVARNPVWRDHLTLWSDALAKSPDSAIAHLNYGYALMYAKRSAEGREHLRRAVALDPGLVDVEIAKGRAYADRGLVKKAILAFHAALVLDPRSAGAHEHLGRLYESRGQDAAAMEEYRSALALGSENPELRSRLARLAAKAGG
jgi:tetratricopeptide (TPR) repeat protein